MHFNPYETTNFFNDLSPKSSDHSEPLTDHSHHEFQSSLSGFTADDRDDIDLLLPQSSISNSEYKHLSRTRPWERLQLDALNQVPGNLPIDDWVFPRLQLGPFRHILKFYMQSSIQMIPQSSPIYRGVTLSTQEGASEAQLLEQAKALGMLPLAIRLHMQNTKQIAIPIEHLSFLVYRREQCKRHIYGQDHHENEDDYDDETTNHRSGEDSSPTSQGAEVIPTEDFQYYPGIELKLGKERDTIIRPAITSIFREFREAFKDELQRAGLRYGDLRMWKDSQLCSAIHVADRFRPGIWNRAVE